MDKTLDFLVLYLPFSFSTISSSIAYGSLSRSLHLSKVLSSFQARNRSDFRCYLEQRNGEERSIYERTFVIWLPNNNPPGAVNNLFNRFIFLYWLVRLIQRRHTKRSDRFIIVKIVKTWQTIPCQKLQRHCHRARPLHANCQSRSSHRMPTMNRCGSISGTVVRTYGSTMKFHSVFRQPMAMKINYRMLLSSKWIIETNVWSIERLR